MALSLFIAKIISISAFLFYGILCLSSKAMIVEFERYGLAKYRLLTGSLEVAGALGLLAGFFIPSLLMLSSAGLATLMFLGIIVRIRIRDPLLAIAPAFILCVTNLFILTQSL